MATDVELISALRDRIEAKLATQASLAAELKMSQGHLCKLLKNQRLTKKSRARIADYLQRPEVSEGVQDELVVTRRVLQRCQAIMHNMQFLLTDVQRMCDQIASTGQKAKT
jgi:transcriptional regulator with XRE-family HTH domain